MAQTADIHNGIMMDYNEELFRLQPSGLAGQLWISQGRHERYRQDHVFPWRKEQGGGTLVMWPPLWRSCLPKIYGGDPVYGRV